MNTPKWRGCGVGSYVLRRAISTAARRRRRRANVATAIICGARSKRRVGLILDDLRRRRRLAGGRGVQTSSRSTPAAARIALDDAPWPRRRRGACDTAGCNADQVRAPDRPAPSAGEPARREQAPRALLPLRRKCLPVECTSGCAVWVPGTALALVCRRAELIRFHPPTHAVPATRSSACYCRRSVCWRRLPTAFSLPLGFCPASISWIPRPAKPSGAGGGSLSAGDKVGSERHRRPRRRRRPRAAATTRRPSAASARRPSAGAARRGGCSGAASGGAPPTQPRRSGAEQVGRRPSSSSASAATAAEAEEISHRVGGGRGRPAVRR